MTDREAYAVWAPPDGTWSPWAKPILFASLNRPIPAPFPPVGIANAYLPWIGKYAANTALIVDLAGGHSITRGLQMAGFGFRPVPLYNTSPGALAIVPLDEIIDGLVCGASVLESTSLPPTAPPAFLIDADRQRGDGPALPGRYDNRWLVFPQDFPSARKLTENGITQVILCQTNAVLPRQDLAHVLLRWQEAGIAILSFAESQADPPQPITVTRPSRFRSLIYRAMALAGFRRNSAGGFGGIVPEPSSGYG